MSTHEDVPVLPALTGDPQSASSVVGSTLVHDDWYGAAQLLYGYAENLQSAFIAHEHILLLDDTEPDMTPSDVPYTHSIVMWFDAYDHVTLDLPLASTDRPSWGVMDEGFGTLPADRWELGPSWSLVFAERVHGNVSPRQFGGFIDHVWRVSEAWWVARSAERAVAKLAHHGSRGRFTTEQEWVGRVDRVEKDYFRATLRDRRRPDEPDAFAEIAVRQLSSDERGHMKEGAVFYWVLGVQDESDGSRSYVSRIRFRRTVPVEPAELAAARERGRARRARLKARGDQRSTQ